MAKGIIAIDVPEYCDYCPAGRIFGFDSRVQCLVAPKEHSVVPGCGIRIKKPDWCPIRPMPNKIGLSNQLPMYDTDIHYEIGWNACLDEILKEK